MTSSLMAVLFGGLGALVGALIKHAFDQRTSRLAAEREVLEKYLLQLQDAVESLYYRLNNLCDWSGRDVMSDDYYRNTTTYAFARVLAHEQLLVSAGVFAKIRDVAFRRRLKSLLHELNWGLRDGQFYHYFRLQLADQATGETGVLSYSRFLERMGEPVFQQALASAEQFVKSIPRQRLTEAREIARKLTALLETETAVPSALTLAEADGLQPD